MEAQSLTDQEILHHRARLRQLTVP